MASKTASSRFLPTLSFAASCAERIVHLSCDLVIAMVVSPTPFNESFSLLFECLYLCVIVVGRADAVWLRETK